MLYTFIYRGAHRLMVIRYDAHLFCSTCTDIEGPFRDSKAKDPTATTTLALVQNGFECRGESNIVVCRRNLYITVCFRSLCVLFPFPLSILLGQETPSPNTPCAKLVSSSGGRHSCPRSRPDAHGRWKAPPPRDEGDITFLSSLTRATHEV